MKYRSQDLAQTPRCDISQTKLCLKILQTVFDTGFRFGVHVNKINFFMRAGKLLLFSFDLAEGTRDI